MIFPPEQDKLDISADATRRAATVDEVDPEPHRIRILSWNIDGLDAKNIKARTQGVGQVILQEKPDVVFLQEVVRIALRELVKMCHSYLFMVFDQERFFVAMMFKKTSVVTDLKDARVVSFPASRLRRNLLRVKAVVKGVKMVLMTTHLESMHDYTEERKRQLNVCLQKVKDAPKTRTVMFGGDLNLRDHELQAVGGLPMGCVDLWEVTGKRPEAKFTWDMMRNDNLKLNIKMEKRRIRSDRLIMRQSRVRHQQQKQPQIKAVHFELVGTDKLPSCNRFPSDHFGILTHLEKIAKASTAETRGAASDLADVEHLRILSWSIDGRSSDSRNRAEGVCRVILQETPDVVFLQGVVNTSLELLQEMCPTYQIITSGNNADDKSLAMMLKETSVVYKGHEFVPFSSSEKKRNILHVKAVVKGVEMELMTTHLESRPTADYAEKRKKQLKVCLKRMKDAPKTAIVMFGGDLNLRDEELQAVGGIPMGCVDMWEVTGQRPEDEFTFDMFRNDNLKLNLKPRKRFDRLIMRQHEVPDQEQKLKAVSFELVGIQKLQSCNRFPSDHWGILTHLDKVETSE